MSLFDYADAVLYPCAACRAPNRFPRSRATEHPKCGACGERVFPEAPVPVGDREWPRAVLECPIPVLAAFWVDCEPWRNLAPTLAAVAAGRAGRLKVVTVDVEANAFVAGRYGVDAVPRMLLLVDGTPLDVVIDGGVSREALEEVLDRHAIPPAAR